MQLNCHGTSHTVRKKLANLHFVVLSLNQWGFNLNRIMRSMTDTSIKRLSYDRHLRAVSGNLGLDSSPMVMP